MNAKPNREIENDANDGGRDGGQCRSECPHTAQGFHIRRAKKDPEEAGREGNPCDKQSCQRRRQQRRQGAKLR